MCSLLALATGAAAAAGASVLRFRRTSHLRRDTISLLLVAVARRVDCEFRLKTDRRFGVHRQPAEVMTEASGRRDVRPHRATCDLRLRQHRYSLLSKRVRLLSVGVKRCLLLRLVQFLRVCLDKPSPFRRNSAARHPGSAAPYIIVPMLVQDNSDKRLNVRNKQRGASVCRTPF